MVGMVVPKKGAHYSTVGRWLSEWANRAGEHARTKMKGNNPASSRKRRAMQQRAQLAAMVAGEMARDENLWVRQPHAAALIMKPVTVGQMADRLLWARANKFLLMSGTVVSAELMLDDLGWEGPWTEVKVPMTFPAENRRIIARGRIDMTAKNKDVAWPQMVEAVNEVLADHPDENVLVHTVSYKLAEYLHRNVRCSHRMLTYLDSAARENVLMEFKDEGRPKVLFASSMDRGVDLPDDLCRVQVVAKVPYPSLGDRQVSARMRLPGGQMWYSVETVRRLVQMTGRGVRSEDDWCLTYILDGQFKSNVLGRNRRFLPDWWKQAVERQ